MSDFINKILGKDIKEQPPKETVFSATFDKEKQIVSALNMVGAGFEARGGSSLMLTEAVENGVDAIIKFNQLQKKKQEGNIRVIIDQTKERILVIDNGTGFLQIKHVCEKPFDSLKEMDETQTGKFARGLQGFRAFCNNLNYITKRLPKDIPSDESDYITSEKNEPNITARIEFISTTSKVKVKYVNDTEFKEFLDNDHGTMAIYETWKPGLFEKFNVTMLFRRLQHHFGELIRQKEVAITIELLHGKIAGIGPEQSKTAKVEPRDYSNLTPLRLTSILYNKNGKTGAITFNLYLSDKGRTERWNQPFLLYQGRPVGDGFISEIDEFSEHPIWKHRLLTGYITCDFCEINELRQGLKINDERDFLFKELLKLERILENKVKEHSRGLYELKLQKQVGELVKDLQLFFKSKNIFNFKIAKSTGFLSKENDEIEVVELAKRLGTDDNLEVPKDEGEGTVIAGVETVAAIHVQEQESGGAATVNVNIGIHGEGNGNTKSGALDKEATTNIPENTPSKEGFEHSNTEINRPANISEPLDVGGKDKSKKKGVRHKPKGFGLVFQDDEFNEDLSWFDDVNSVVIVNSQHPRYLARAQDESQFKSLMNYLAELYIWEITKLIYAKDEEAQKAMKFLDFKFEYSEKIRQDEKESRFANESE